MLDHIAEEMDPEFIFAKRCIKYIKMQFVSEYCTENSICTMQYLDTSAIIGEKFKHLNRKYCMDESIVNSE